MGPETQAWISGNFTGQKLALVLLVKVLNAHGIMRGADYVKALKDTFNDPDAQFERQSYDFLRGLAKTLEEELDGLPRRPE